MRSDGRGTRRDGAIAVQFALLAFGFFAIAAAVIDMRLAMLAQQQMQVATDTAAVEALRQRDAIGSPTTLRETARDAVLVAFDDDMDPADGDPLNYGAGPMITLTGGVAESNALARITIPDDPVYDPVLELNAGNEQYGDIVTGTFNRFTTRGIEAPDYSRNDFAPGAPGADPATQDSVLVRIRRTPVVFGSDPPVWINPLDNETDASSSAPPITFLFGLGTSIHRAPGSAYNPRTDGITVRATSIAAARRAMQVSGPGPSFGEIALQRFALISYQLPNQVAPQFAPPTNQFPVPGTGGPHLFKPPAVTPTRPPAPVPGENFAGRWDSTAVNGSIDVFVDPATGYVKRDIPGGPPPTEPILGYFCTAWVAGNNTRLPAPATLVGQIADPIFPLTPVAGETIVPIIRPIFTEGYLVVIGFARVRVTLPDPGDPTRFRITKLAPQVLRIGASAAAPDALSVVTQSDELRIAHADFTAPVLTPVLER